MHHALADVLEPAALVARAGERDTAVIVIEPILGESGYMPAPKVSLEGLCMVCYQHRRGAVRVGLGGPYAGDAVLCAVAAASAEVIKEVNILESVNARYVPHFLCTRLSRCNLCRMANRHVRSTSTSKQEIANGTLFLCFGRCNILPKGFVQCVDEESHGHG